MSRLSPQQPLSCFWCGAAVAPYSLYQSRHYASREPVVFCGHEHYEWHARLMLAEYWMADQGWFT